MLVASSGLRFLARILGHLSLELSSHPLAIEHGRLGTYLHDIQPQLLLLKDILGHDIPGHDVVTLKDVIGQSSGPVLSQRACKEKHKDVPVN